MRHRLALVLLVAATAQGREVRIAGSDLLAHEITPLLQTMAARDDRAVTIEFAGSHPGWRALQDGRADIALLSFAPNDAWPNTDFHAIPVAWQTVVVLAPATATLHQISFAQLASVFGTQAGAEAKRWSDLGVPGEMGPRGITPWALTRPPLPTLELFRHLVLPMKAWSPTLRIESTESALRARLRSPEGGLALVAQAPAHGDGTKILAVAAETNGAAFAPTPAAIERGDYPLQWPIYLVFRHADVPRLYPWLQFLLGDATAQALQRSGLQPASPAHRAAQTFALEHW